MAPEIYDKMVFKLVQLLSWQVLHSLKQLAQPKSYEQALWVKKVLKLLGAMQKIESSHVEILVSNASSPLADFLQKEYAQSVDFDGSVFFKQSRGEVSINISKFVDDYRRRNSTD